MVVPLGLGGRKARRRPLVLKSASNGTRNGSGNSTSLSVTNNSCPNISSISKEYAGNKKTGWVSARVW